MTSDHLSATADFMITKVINPLVGCVILGGVTGIPGALDPADLEHYGDIPADFWAEEHSFGVLLRRPDGSEVVLWVDRDAEGNGPGWLKADPPLKTPENG